MALLEQHSPSSPVFHQLRRFIDTISPTAPTTGPPLQGSPVATADANQNCVTIVRHSFLFLARSLASLISILLSLRALFTPSIHPNLGLPLTLLPSNQRSDNEEDVFFASHRNSRSRQRFYSRSRDRYQNKRQFSNSKERDFKTEGSPTGKGEESTKRQQHQTWKSFSNSRSKSIGKKGVEMNAVWVK